MRKAVPLATKLPSFATAADSVAETLEIALTIKRVERLTERIGGERVTEREAAVAAWEALPLVAKQTAPPGVKAPAKVCVSCDGGRLQRCDLPPEAKSHWCETKVGICLELEAGSHAEDPCPAAPDKFLDLVQMEKVTREIKRSVAKGSPFARQDAAAENAADATAQVAAAREPVVAEPPKVIGREVVASLASSELFGRQLAAQAWSLGFAAATAKAFVADGGSANWGIWQRHFKHLHYVPILDFIHALTYIFSAAMAGWSRDEGAAVYVRWITWVWRGEVVRVIAELAARAAELGAPEPETGETDPRQILAETLTYLTNQQSRMNYSKYRRDGLPITSSHIESTVKQINYRVKGSEKFWSASGGEALLQLRADVLCDTAPLDRFWSRRAQQSTGTRTSHRPRTAA